MDNNSSLNLAARVLIKLGEEDLSPEEIKRLCEFLPDFLLWVRAKSYRKSREELRRLLGLPPIELITEVDFDQLPGIGELTFEIVGFRKPNTCPRRCQTGHCAGIGDMRGENFAVVEADIGEEALVAFD